MKPNKPTAVKRDASKHAIIGVLEPNGAPVAFNSWET